MTCVQALEGVRSAPHRPGTAAARLADAWFDGRADDAGKFLAMALAEPLRFGNDQLTFYNALVAAGALRPVRAGHQGVDVCVHGTNFATAGVQTCAPDALAQGLAAVLAGDEMRGALREVTDLPMGVAHAGLFWTRGDGVHAMRARLLDRFLVPGAPDRTLWGAAAPMQLIQTPDFLRLLYLATPIAEADPRQLTEGAHAIKREVLRKDHEAHVWTSATPVQHVMELTAARQVLAFYIYFLMRVLRAPTSVRMLAANSVADAHRLWEVCFSMLMGWNMGDLAALPAQIDYQVLCLLADIAEQMRTFIMAPLTDGDSTLRAVYARTSNYDTVVAANMGVREMLVKSAAHAGSNARSMLLAFYVPTYSTTLDQLVRSFVRASQVVQLRRLQDWLALSGIELADVLYPSAGAVPDRFYACRFPAGVHLYRLQWTIAYYENACPALFSNLSAQTHLGLDENNLPYMLIPRRAITALRLAMLADTFTLPSFAKCTAIYPLLVRLYMSCHPAGAPGELFGSIDLTQLSLLTIAHVLGHWVGVPAQAKQPMFVRRGLPALGQSVEYMTLLHRIAAILVAGAEARPDAPTCLPGADFGVQTALRSFLMAEEPHTVTQAAAQLLCRASVLNDAARHIGPVLHVAEQIREPAKPRGRPPKRPAGEPRPPAPVSTDINLAIVVSDRFDRELARLCPSHPLLHTARSADRHRVVNAWLYTAALAMDQADANTVLLGLGIDRLARLGPTDYARARYACPASYTSTWPQSTDWVLRNAHALCRTDATPRAISADQLRPLVRLLCELEHFVCESDVARYGGAVAQPLRRSVATPEGNADLANALAALYTTLEGVATTMPVGAFFDREAGVHRMARYDDSFCLLDIAPTDGTTPVSTYIGSCGVQHTSDCVMDLTVMHRSDVVAANPANPDLRRAVLRQIMAASHKDKAPLH